jgi:hypothetical protein
MLKESRTITLAADTPAACGAIIYLAEAGIFPKEVLDYMNCSVPAVTKYADSLCSDTTSKYYKYRVLLDTATSPPLNTKEARDFFPRNTSGRLALKLFECGLPGMTCFPRVDCVCPDLLSGEYMSKDGSAWKEEDFDSGNQSLSFLFDDTSICTGTLRAFVPYSLSDRPKHTLSFLARFNEYGELTACIPLDVH